MLCRNIGKDLKRDQEDQWNGRPPLCNLLSMQEVLQEIQQSIVAAKMQINSKLKALVKKTPKKVSDFGDMEIKMRKLVHMRGWATQSEARSLKDVWIKKLCRHLIHAEA